MNCPHCHSAQTTKLPRTTDLGYAVFRCKGCGRTFNERTATPSNKKGRLFRLARPKATTN